MTNFESMFKKFNDLKFNQNSKLKIRIYIYHYTKNPSKEGLTL